MLGDTIPMEGTWSEKDLRSFSPLPFTVEKEGGTLYIYSEKDIDDVYICIISAERTIYYENVCNFFSSGAITLSLNNFSTEIYYIEILHKNGRAIGRF